MVERKLNVDIIPALKKLQVITKSTLSAAGVTGQYQSVFKGRGLEFEDYRTYSTLDDSSLIDWKASKKSHSLLIKEYVEERNVNVVFAVDVNESMIFGSTEKLKNEYTVELVASLAHAILGVDDSVGLVMFNDGIVVSLPPSRKRTQFFDFTRNLINVDHYGGAVNFDNLFTFLLNTYPRDTVLMIISDFIGFDEEHTRNFKILTSKFDTIGIMVRDPRDKTLPASYEGEIFIKDPYSNKNMVIEPKLLKEIYEEEAKRQEDSLRTVFSETGSDFISLTTDEPFLKPILKLFQLRGNKKSGGGLIG